MYNLASQKDMKDEVILMSFSDYIYIFFVVFLRKLEKNWSIKTVKRYTYNVYAFMQ